MFDEVFKSSLPPQT